MNEFANFVKANNLDIHLGILGFLFTIIGFVLTFIKLFTISRNNEEIKIKVEQTRKVIATIDTFRELTAALELLKTVRERMIANDVNEVPTQLLTLRLTLIKIREAHAHNEVNFSVDIQGLVTQLTNMEAKIIGRVVGGAALTNKKHQDELKALASCLDELQAFLSRIQNLAASNHE